MIASNESRRFGRRRDHAGIVGRAICSQRDRTRSGGAYPGATSTLENERFAGVSESRMGLTRVLAAGSKAAFDATRKGDFEPAKSHTQPARTYRKLREPSVVLVTSPTGRSAPSAS